MPVRGTRLSTVLIAPAGLLILAVFAVIAASAGAGRAASFLPLFAAAFAGYLIAAAAVLRPPGGEAGAAGALRLVVALAVAYRLVFLFLPPALSTDLWRYLWDGRLVCAGLSPYAHAPADPALLPLRDDLYARLEHRDVPAIYPPAAQALFAAGGACGRSATALKALFVGADLLGMVLIARLLRLRGLPPLRLLLYAWNPLVVIEVAWSGHLEPAALACALAGTAAIIQKRPMRGALALAVAGLVKLLPWFLFLPLWRHLTRRAAAAGAAAALVAVAFLPFAGDGARLAGGFSEYARRWQGNGSVFPIVEAILVGLDPAPALTAAIAAVRARVPWSGPLDLLYPWVHPPFLARAVCFAAALAAAAMVARRVADPLRACSLTIGAAILLSPTVHPWYLIWMVPWLCFLPSPAWIFLSGAVVLAYAAPHDAAPPAWIPVAEYGPFALLLALEWWRRRRGGTRGGAPGERGGAAVARPAPERVVDSPAPD
jgi:hypothetical protein